MKPPELRSGLPSPDAAPARDPAPFRRDRRAPLRGHARASRPPSRRRSRSGPTALAEIRAEGLALFGRAPEGAELDALIEARVADELLYREALARGLDREDRSVRRRLARNLAFLRAAPGEPDVPAEGEREEALYREALALGMDRTDTVVRRKLAQRARREIEGAARAEPSEAELRAWLAAHPERALGPPRVRFRHLFFDPARRGAERAEADARAVVQRRAAPRAARRRGPVPRRGGAAAPGRAGDRAAPRRRARRSALHGTGRRVERPAALLARLARGARRGARRRPAGALRIRTRRGARRGDRGAQRRGARRLPRRAPRARASQGGLKRGRS